MKSSDEAAPVIVRPQRRSPAFPVRPTTTTAILVDGGFYVRRAKRLFGAKSPEQRADELLDYCKRHLRKSHAQLYRIFDYDCPPSEKVIYHPLTRTNINLAKTNNYAWMKDFHQALVKKRKVALRMGEELETQSGYQLKQAALKDVLAGRRPLESLTAEDFHLDITQKGVDMKIGLDIADLAFYARVDQIVMISGDSDFVPAAKHARRAGIDFVLDPLWAPITPSLHEHIDGLWECVRRPPENLKDPLHVDNMPATQVEEEEDEVL